MFPDSVIRVMAFVHGLASLLLEPIAELVGADYDARSCLLCDGIFRGCIARQCIYPDFRI